MGIDFMLASTAKPRRQEHDGDVPRTACRLGALGFQTGGSGEFRDGVRACGKEAMSKRSRL